MWQNNSDNNNDKRTLLIAIVLFAKELKNAIVSFIVGIFNLSMPYLWLHFMSKDKMFQTVDILPLHFALLL